MTRVNLFSVIIIQCFFASMLYATGNALSLDSGKVDLKGQFEILEETGNTKSIAEVLSGKLNEEFSVNSISTSIKRQERSFWVRLTINSKMDKEGEWLIRFWNYYTL